MNPLDIQVRVQNDVALAREAAPEAVSVEIDLSTAPVATAEMAAAVAPFIAKDEYPTRRFGAALHVEQVGPALFEVAVEVRAPRLAEVTIGRGMPMARR